VMTRYSNVLTRNGWCVGKQRYRGPPVKTNERVSRAQSKLSSPLYQPVRVNVSMVGESAGKRRQT
jgi:hypothetical protein